MIKVPICCCAQRILPHLDQILPSLTQERPELSVLLLNGPDQDTIVGQWMGLGATDVVVETDSDHVLWAVKRELDRICQRERLQATRRALKEAEQRCQLLLASSTAAIAYVHEGMHIYANEGYIHLFGFTDADDMVGLPLMDLLDAGSADTLKAELKRFRKGEESSSFEFVGTTTAGESLTGHMTLSAAEFEGEHCMQVTVRADTAPVAPAAVPAVAPTVAAEPQDNLKTLCDAIDATIRDEEVGAPSLIAFRIDGFTPIQREHGIDAANQLAAQVLDLARKCNPDRPVWQVDGYNFITASFLEDAHATFELVEQIRAGVEGQVFEVNERSLRASVTLVIETITERASVSKLADAAVARLLDAEDTTNKTIAQLKSNGSSGVAQEDSEEVVSLINHAIEKQKFVLLYQPIISLRGDADEHYEVFLRMIDRQGNEMAPDTFLKTAIDHGVAGKIDRWVVLQSIKMLSMHRAKGHNTRLTINLTSNSVEDSEFMQWLGVAIKAARLPIDAVIFQITEANASSNLPAARKFLAALREMHCQASLSRFGLASDPFDVLKQLNVDYVKLDGSHVLAMADDPDAKDVLLEMIRALQSKGKLTIVPMVESANVLSTIWQAGANYIQGHYLQEPTTEMDYDFTTEDD